MVRSLGKSGKQVASLLSSNRVNFGDWTMVDDRKKATELVRARCTVTQSNMSQRYNSPLPY